MGMAANMQILLLIQNYKQNNKYEMNFKFTKMVNIISNIIQLLNDYDIQRVFSLSYYKTILWNNEYDYVHPKCDTLNSLDINKCKILIPSFYYLLYNMSLFLNLMVE